MKNKNMNEENKREKKKPMYIDDGTSYADMSAFGNRRFRSDGSPRASFKEQFKTYIEAVKLMFVPMLVVLGIITIAFLFVYIIL